MDKKVKEEWVKRLRSGEYKQGFQKLRSDDTGNYHYCCLGVLNTIAIEEGIVGKNDPAKYTRQFGDAAFLGPRVSKWAGLDRPTQGHLARMNDGDDDTHLNSKGFRAIATYIERNL